MVNRLYRVSLIKDKLGNMNFNSYLLNGFLENFKTFWLLDMNSLVDSIIAVIISIFKLNF